MNGFIVEDPEQIRILGSPIRQDIVDFVDAVGPSTMAEIGRGVGVPADRLYYHVDMLLDAGLLLRAEAEGRGMVLKVPGHGVSLRYRPQDPAVVAAVQDAVGTMLRSVERRFASALAGEHGPVAVEGAHRNLQATRVRGRLSDQDLREANALIARLHRVFARSRGEPHAEGRMHEVVVVLSPLPETER